MAVPSDKNVGRPRDPQLAVRRCEQILAAASSIFAAQGYRQTDVQVIADALGIGKGTIYRYFPSKEELFLAAVDRGMRQLQEEVREATEPLEDPLDQIAAAVRAYLAFFDRHGEFVELLIQERAEFKDRKKPTYFEYQEASVDRWRNLYTELINQRRARSVPVDRILDVMSDTLYGAIFTNAFAGRRKSFEVQAEDILDIVFHGILSEQERHKRKEGEA